MTNDAREMMNKSTEHSPLLVVGSTVGLADDSWKIAKRTKKGIVHLWNLPSRRGNPDFFRSACNITAR